MSYICFLTQEGWMKVYKNKDLNKKTEFFHKHTIKGKEALNANAENEEEKEEVKEEDKKVFKQRLFLGSEEYKVFFRRFSWSPDGSFLLTPSAIFQESADATPEFTVYGFLRGNLVRPAFTLPGLRYTATGVSFSPNFYRKTGGKQGVEALIDVPYALVFAVQTIEQIVIYTTESIYPIAVIGNLHYAYITDTVWISPNQMMVSSFDGYCSTVVVDPKLTGEVLPIAEIPKEELRNLYTERSRISFQQKADLAQQVEYQKVNFKVKSSAKAPDISGGNPFLENKENQQTPQMM